MPELRWGIKTSQQHTTYEAIVPVWKEADANPVFTHAWLFDHFNPIVGNIDGPCYEGWTMLAALAAQTERLRLGLMVAGNTYRNPAVHAHIAATVDLISHGRLDFGVGAGWNVYEHESMGIPLYEPAERIKRLGEACELTKLLFTQDVVDYDGAYYQLKEARLEPKPVQKPWPPFMIGGSGEQLTLRVVARHADLWNAATPDLETFLHKKDVLFGHCAAIGRDPSEIEISVQTRVDYDDLPATVANLQPLIANGATHIILMLSYPYPEGIVARLAEEVVAPFA
ncbi:MAG TPA: TIGR03560 family F420-dependent LLM class oxidoreductase [Thermomicrobiales bacterium]|nr:TIGR03560 family F420-dependent LLM class oxidoreductase [Thermomicrobiales bacterium]